MECSKCGYIYNGVENISNCPKCGQNFGLKEEEGLSKKSKAAVAVGAAAGAVAGIANLAAKEGKIFASSRDDKKTQGSHEQQEDVFSETTDSSEMNQNVQENGNASETIGNVEQGSGNTNSSSTDDGINFDDETINPIPAPGNDGNNKDNSSNEDTSNNGNDNNDDSSNEDTSNNGDDNNDNSSNEDTSNNGEDSNNDSSNEDTSTDGEDSNNDSIDEDTPSTGEDNNDSVDEDTPSTGEDNNDSIDEDTPSTGEDNNDSIDEDTPSTGEDNNDSIDEDTPSTGEDNNDSIDEDTPSTGEDNNNDSVDEETPSTDENSNSQESEIDTSTPTTPTTPASTERNTGGSGGSSGGGGVPDIKTDLSDVESVLAMLGSSKSLMSVSSGKGFGDVFQANGSEYSDIGGVLDAVVDKSSSLSKYVTPFNASSAQKVKSAVGGGGASGYASELAGKVENLKGLLGKLYGGNYELAYNMEMQGKLYTTDPVTGEPVATQALLDLQNLGINTSTLDEDVYSFTAGYFEDEANKIKSGDMSYKDSYLYKSMNDPTLTAEDIIKHYRDFTDQISASMVMLGTAGILSMTTTYGDANTTLSQFVDNSIYDGMTDKNKSDTQRYLETMRMNNVTSKDPGSMTSDDKKFLDTMNQHTENIREEYRDAQEDAARENALNGTRRGGPQMVAYDGGITVDAALQAEYDHVFNLTAIAANNLCFTTTVAEVISGNEMSAGDRLFMGAEERIINVGDKVCTVPARSALANQYCDLYLDMMGNTSTQRLNQGGLAAENFYLQYQLNDVAIPNWDKANEEYLGLYENGYEGLAEKYGITDLNSLKTTDPKAYNSLKGNENLFDESGNLLPGLNSDDIALAYAKYNAEKELDNYNSVTADMIVFSNFAVEIDKGNQEALDAYTKYMDNPNMTWEDMTLNGRIEIPSVIDANVLNDQLIDNEANRLDTLSSYEDVYRGTIQKEMAAIDQEKSDNLWSRIGLALQQSSMAQSGGLTPAAVEMQIEQSNALFEQQMDLNEQNNDLKERSNALNNIVTASNIKIEEIGYKLNAELIQGYSDYTELAVPKYLPTNTLDLNEIEAAIRTNMPQGELSDKEYEQLVSDTADYQLALNIIEQEKNGKNVNLLFYSKDVRNYVENIYYYENNRSAEDLQKMIGAMNYSFNKAYESGNTAYAFQTFNNKFNTLNESGFQLEAQARAEWILTNQAGEIKNKFMESFMDYESMGMTDAFGMTAALLSVAEQVEHIVDTTVVPFCFGVQSFGRGLINAVTNTLEYVVTDLGVGDFYSDLFENVPGLEYMPGMEVGRFLANYEPQKHTTSMGDAVFGYMSSAVNNGEYGFNKLDSISMQAFQSIGNMAIPMIVSGVCQPLGSALLFTSAYGNTFEQSRIDGMNPHAAFAYSIMSAGTEMVMERVLGGMPNMGKAASAVGKAGFVKSMFSEAKEEMLQEFIDPFLEDVAYALFPQTDAEGNIKDEGLRNVFSLDYWEHYIKEDFDPEAIAMAGIVAMFSAGITNSGKLYSSIKSQQNYGIDIATGNKSNVFDFFKGQGLTDSQAALKTDAVFKTLAEMSKTKDIKAAISENVNYESVIDYKLNENLKHEISNINEKNNITDAQKASKIEETKNKYKEVEKEFKEHLKNESITDTKDLSKKEIKQFKEATQLLDKSKSEVTDDDIRFVLFMDQLATTIPNLEQLLANTDAAAAVLSSLLEASIKPEEKEEYQKQLAELEARRKEIVQKLKDMKNNLNAELEANKTEIDKLSQEALDIQEKLKTETDNDVRTQLENELSQKMAAIEELQNANAQVNTKLGETTIPDLENRINSLNEELAKLNEQESKFDENTPTEVRQELETERTRIQNEINQSSKRLVNALQDANNRMIEGLNEINNRNNNNNDNNTDGTSNVDGPKPNMPRVEKLEEGVVRTITENQRKIKELEKQGIHPNGSPVKMSPATREVVNNVQTMNNIVEAGTDLLNNPPSADTSTNPVSTASVGTSTNQVAANVDTMNNIVGTGNAIVGVASGGATVGALIGGIKSGILDLESKIKNFDKNGNNLNENPDGTRDTRTRKELKKELHEKRQMLGKIENSLHEYSMTENSPLKEFLDQMNSEIRDMELGKFDSEKVAEAYEINITTMSDKTAAQLKAQVTEFIKAINSINYSNMTFDQKLNEKFADVQTLFDTLMNKIDFTESLSAVESIIKTIDIDASNQTEINTKLEELTNALTGLETNIREYNSTFDSSKLTEIKKAFNTINVQIEGLSTELSNSLSVLSNNYGSLAVNIETSGVSAMTAENIKSISDLLGVVYENINGTYSYFDSLTKLTQISDMSKNHLKYMNVFKVSNEFNEMVNKFKNGDIDFDEFKVKLNNFGSGFNTVMNTYYSIDSTAFETVEPNTITKNQTSIQDVFSSITTSNLSEAFELLKNQIGTIFVDSDAKKFEFITGLNELEKDFKHLLENTSTESVNTSNVTELKAKLDGIVNSLTKHINNNATNIKVTEVNGTLVVETSNSIDTKVVEDVETATEKVAETTIEETADIEQLDTNSPENNILELETDTSETLDVPNFESVEESIAEMSVPEVEVSNEVNQEKVEINDVQELSTEDIVESKEVEAEKVEFKQPEVVAEEVKVETETVNVEQKVVTIEQLKNEVLDIMLNAKDTDAALETFAKKITDMLETDRSTVKEFFNAEGIRAIKVNVLAKCDYKTVEMICEHLMTYKSAQEIFTIASNADYVNSITKTEGFNQILWSSGLKVINRIKLLYIAKPAVMNILKSIANNSTEFANASTVNDYLAIITNKMGHAKQRLYQTNDLDLDRVVEITDKLSARVYLTHSINKVALDLVVNQFVSNINSPQIPTMLKNCLDSIEFHDAKNPHDYYWATQYGAKNILVPFLSAATGGFGSFTSWALSPATLSTISHELGHSFDTKYAEMMGYGTSFFSKNNPAWQQAIEADGKKISSYGKNSFSEDFAETMSMFVTNRTKLQKQFPNRYNQLVSMMREYAAYTLKIDNVTDIPALRELMIENGIDSQVVDNILNSGHSLENIKSAVVDYVAFTDDIQTTLETIKDTQVLTIESVKSMSIEDIVNLANTDLDSIPTLMKSGKYEFLQNPDLSTEAFAQAVEYMKSENKLFEIANISIDVGTNVQKAFVGFMNNLHIKTDSSIDLDLQAKLLSDVMLNPNSQIADIKMVSGFLTTMGYIKSPITVSDLSVAKNLLDAGYANIVPTSNIYSRYSQLLQEKLATTYSYESRQIINQLVANKSDFIGELINSKNISVVQGLMRNISQLDIDGFDFVFSQLDAKSVPNLSKLLFDGISKYSDGTPYLSISDQRMQDVIGITNPNVRDYLIKKTFEVLFEDVGYDFNSSRIVKDIAKSFGNGYTTKDAYWGLAQAWKQAKSNLYRNAIGLKQGEVVNNAGVNVRVYGYSTNPIMKKHLSEFNKAFNQLPPVYKNCAQYMGLHGELCELNVVEIIKNDGKPRNGEFYGYNYSGTRQIELFNGHVGLWNIAHEIGHIFDSEYSDLLAGVRSNRISYNPFSETGVWSNAIEQDAALSQNRYNPFGKYVSQYGKDSVEVTHVGFKEDFCDSMAKFFTDRNRFLEQFPNRARIIISMMYDFTSMKYENYLKTEQGLRDLLQLFNEDPSQVDALLKNYSFEATRDAVIEHITFGSEMNPNLDTMRDLATQLGTSNSTRAIYNFNATETEITAPLGEVVNAVNGEINTNAGYSSNIPSQVSNLNDVIDVINAMGRNPQNIINAYIQTGNINLFTRTSGVRDFVSQYTVREFESLVRGQNTRNNQNISRVTNKAERLTQFDYVEFEMRKGNYAVLNDSKLSYETLRQAIVHLAQTGRIDILNQVGLHVTDKRIVNGLIGLGVSNFTVSPELYDFTITKFMSEYSISDMADLMETFLKTNNPIINAMFNPKLCSIEDMLRILHKVSPETFNEISSKYFTFDYKLQLFEKLDYYNFAWLLNVDANIDPVAHRNANIFFNKLLSDISNEIISKVKVREFIPFLPNSIVNKIRMSAPSKYVNMSDNDVIKVITDAKSVAEYELIKIGYGMSMKPIDFNGIEVRFFANNEVAHQNLLRKFNSFKKIYNKLPSTFRSCLTQMNFLDMSDPDNDSYSIDTNGNILFRFTAAGAGGNGKFYLWNNGITTNLMAHEIAHSLDTEYAKLKLGSKGYYTELNNSWQKAVERDNRRVTKYGDTSLQEDFAESVAIYMEHKASFARNYPNRTAQIEAMLRDLTVMKNGLENISTMRDMANKLIECKVPKAQILDFMKQGYNVEQLKSALIDHLALGVDMYDALATSTPTSIKQASNYSTVVNNRAVNVNNRKGVKSWFSNKFFNQNVQTASPMVNQINQMIATQGIANITITNAADISVSELRQISDLSKVNFFVSGIFSDINGNIKQKYNNPRYIARHTYTGIEMLSINAKLDQLQSRIDMSLPVKERARQIYELIASEYSYMKGYNESENTYLVSQSLRGITSNNIVGRQGLICAGYASVFKELCSRCGITCDYIRGDVITDRLTNSGGRHAWNVVIDTNGEVIPVDCCWRSGGGKDYFGKSDMFAKDRYADADETYKDYAKPYDEYQAYNMIDFTVRTMDMKYGPGSGIKALREYLKTGNINLMTSTNGARQTLSQMSFEDISDYIKANSHQDLSLYENQIRSIYESMAIRHNSYGQATDQLVEYIKTGNIYLITSYNGARDAINSIPVEVLKQFVNLRLSGVEPIIATSPRVADVRNIHTYKSQKTSIFNGIQTALQDSLGKFRETLGNINVNSAESSGLVTIERNPAKAPYGQSEKNLINSSDGDVIFKQTTENESFAEVIGYEIAKSIDLSSARYDFATMDGKNGVVSYSIEQDGFEFKRANQLLSEANQSYSAIVHKFESITNEDIENANLDVKKQTIKELIELSKHLKLQESTLFETIDVETITEYNFGTIYTDLTSAINNKINEYSTALDSFNTNQINVSNISTLVEMLTNTTDMNIDKESAVNELTKMFIFDSVLYPGFRPLGDWGMMYNKTTGELTFAPLYDNSSICGLDGTVSTITDERLNMLKDLIDKSDSKTISMIKDTLSKFNTEEINKIFEQIESQYGKQIPSEIRTTVVQSIETNMERINQLFEDNSSNGNSSPDSSSNPTTKVFDITDLKTQLEEALRIGLETGKVILKIGDKKILLNGTKEGKSYRGFFKHVAEVGIDKILTFDVAQRIYGDKTISDVIQKLGVTDPSIIEEIRWVIREIDYEYYNNQKINNILSSKIEKTISDIISSSMLDDETAKLLAKELKNILKTYQATSHVMSKDTTIKLMRNSGINTDPKYSEFYDYLTKLETTSFTIEDIEINGVKYTIEDVRSIVQEAKFKLHTAALQKFFEGQYFQKESIKDENGNVVIPLDKKTLVNALDTDKQESIYEALVRTANDTDGNVDLVLFHFQPTNIIKPAARMKKMLNRIVKEIGNIDFAKMSEQEVVSLIENFDSYDAEEQSAILKEIKYRVIGNKLFEIAKKAKEINLNPNVKLKEIMLHFLTGEAKDKTSQYKDKNISHYKEYMELVEQANKILTEHGYQIDMRDKVKNKIDLKVAEIEEVQRKLKAKENRQERVFLPPSSSSNIEVPSINAGAVLQPSQSVIEASSFSQFTLKELFSNEGFKDAIFKVGEETYSLIEYSIKSAFEKGRLAFDNMKQAKIFELDSKLKEEAAKKGMNLKEYGKYGNNISELMKSLEIPAKEIATKLYAKSQTKEVAITEAIKSLQIEGRYLTGLDYRLKSIDSIARKLVSKSISKEDNNIQVQSLEKSSESMGDLIRYTLILDEANYTEGVKESLRKLEEMGFEIIDLKNAWNRNRTPKYQGINVGLLAKDGTIFELQFHTELSFITKETLTHEYYEIARNDSIEEENRKLADVIQTSLQENVIVPEGVETIESFDIKIIKDINDITLEQLNKVKNPNKTTYRIDNVDYSFNEVKIMISFKEGTIFNKDTLIEDISKIDANLFVEQLSSNEYVVKNIETGEYVSFIAGDQKGILKAINVNDAIIHCIKQEISLDTYFTEEQINNFNSTHQLVLRDVIYDSVNGQYIRIIKDRLPVVFDMSNLNKLLEKYSLEEQKMILNSLSTSQRIEYLSNIEGMKIKNEILSTLDSSYSDIEKARKLYVELAKRVTYDATFMKTQSQFIFNRNVSFENLTDNNVICKGWAELYYELLLEVGFDPNDVKIMSATSDSITHKWVTLDLHNGKTLVADAAESIIHGSDMSHAKYGGKLVGFVIVNNAHSSERLRDLLYTDIDYYQSLLAEIKLIDKKIGYIKGQTYTGEIVQKAKKLFNFSFKKDKKKAEEIAMSLFDTPIMKGSSGLDVYLYYEKLIRYNNLNMNTLDVQHGTRVDDNGNFEFYALLTSDYNRTYMVYTQSLGKVKFNDYNEYIRFLQEKGIH